MAQTHNILLIVFPLQGHINPTLQLAKRLANLGVRVTYMTTVSAINRMSEGSAIEGISFTGFSDGNVKDNIDELTYELERCGSQALRDFVAGRIKEGTGFTHIIYSLLFPWVATVAHEFQIPITFLWVQAASILNIYYQRYMTDYGDFIAKNIDDPSFSFELPGLPPLKSDDLPSFLLPSNRYQSAIPITRRHVQILNEETKPKVLVNTFDALEAEALKAIQNYNMVGIGINDYNFDNRAVDELTSLLVEEL
ncbi:hypothetical protein SLEP1_g37642 [Rubroshorea leprosula]|uniref:Uncharacterized protein n=1 Tax=Rubroshorea leprosula TaxID=152421 RepID=A0AAV5KVL7_9ROSI|nr:hypothetical protein SLEP1_g37642 [Rubroshorea leprosula]